MTFESEITEHDLRETEARLRGGDTIENVSHTLYYRAQLRSAGEGKPAYAIDYTREVVAAAVANLTDRPELQAGFDLMEVSNAVAFRIPHPKYNDDTSNRLWVLEQLHHEVTKFQKDPSNGSSLRSFLEQIEPYVSSHPDNDLLTDSGNVNYVLENYAYAAQRAIDDSDPAQASKALAHFTSGPYSVTKAIEYPDAVVYLRDWTATDLGIHYALRTPSISPNHASDPNHESNEIYGGLNTDHPLLQKLIQSREPHLLSVQRDLSLAVNCLEKGYSEKETADLLMNERTGLSLTDTAGRNPFSRAVGAISNGIRKIRFNAEHEYADLGSHEEYVIGLAKDLQAAFHRGLALEADSREAGQAAEPPYYGLESDNPLLRELIMAHAPNDPETQRALSLAVNGVQQNHSQQRIFRDLDNHLSASTQARAVSATTAAPTALSAQSTLPPPRPIPTSAHRTIQPVAAAEPVPVPGPQPVSPLPPVVEATRVPQPEPTPAPAAVAHTPAPPPPPVPFPSPAAQQRSAVLREVVSSHGPGTQTQPRLAQPQPVLEKAGPPRTVTTPAAIKPVADKKQILNLAKEINAKYQQQITLREILAGPGPSIQGSAFEPQIVQPQAQSNEVEQSLGTQRGPHERPIRQRERFRSHSRGR